MADKTPTDIYLEYVQEMQGNDHYCGIVLNPAWHRDHFGELPTE